MTHRAQSVIVTGVSSFIGIHLANALSEAGFEVTATLTKPRGKYTGIQAQRLNTLPDSVALEALDIQDDAAIVHLMNQKKPDIWIHHAGYSTGYGSADYDLATGFSINVEPLDTLYRCCAELGTGVVITGSSAEYGHSHEPNREEENCQPETRYGQCKLAETNKAKELALHYNVPTRIARVFNPIGPLDNPNKVLPLAAAALNKGRSIELSPCTQRRDFISIQDLCAGYIALIGDLPRAVFDLFNLSNGQGTVLKDLMVVLAEKLNADPGLLLFGAIPMRPGEPAFSVGANDKAKAILGWTPRPIEESLETDLLARVLAL